MHRLFGSITGLRWLAVCAGLAALALIMIPASGQAADEVGWMYDPDAVVEIDIGGLSEAELDALEAEPGEYQKGTFELKVDGVTKGAPLADVGIRRKGGFGSSRPIKTGKSGLKVRFDEFVDDQLFFGIKRLTLNNMFQDESMLHETLTYELFDALGLPASRTGYTFVNLNGEKYGVMLNLETLDEISLPQWLPTTGHLYEADAAGVDVRPGEADTFEVDEGDDEDLTDLEALIAAANDEGGDWSDGMAAVADLRRMTAEWAVERYVAHWDGYAGGAESTPDPEDPIRPNNYYLHSDEAGVFQLLPWGVDQTWEFDGLGFEDPAGGLMFNKCLADASCKSLYLDGLTEIHCLNPELDQRGHAEDLDALLAPYQDEEDDARRGYPDAAIAEEVENVEEFAEERAEQLEDYLAAEGRLGLGKSPCAPPPGDAGGIYTSGAVTEIDLELPTDSIEELEAEPDEYVAGDFTLRFTDGTPGGEVSEWPTLDDVGVRLKGNVGGSFRPLGEKSAFKLKFNEFVDGQKLFGLKKLTLNNMVQDPSMLHETLAYEAFRAAGVPAPRTGYSFVRVNGEPYGVYMNVETFDDVALERWFGEFDDDSQHLYEGEYESEVDPGGAEDFEVDEGDEEDIGDLEALIAAVDASSPSYSERMEGIADLDEMTRMWGVEKYVGMWDGYAGMDASLLPNNFYLYSAGPAGPFQMFPWGTDQAWESPDDIEFDGSAGLMFDKCLPDPACKSLYMDGLRTIGGVIQGLQLESLVSCIAARLDPWQAMEGASFREYDVAETALGVQDAIEAIEERPEELTEWLETQSGEVEQIHPSGEPASCAVPELPEPPEPEPDPETEPETETERQSDPPVTPAAAPGAAAHPPIPIEPGPKPPIGPRLRRLPAGVVARIAMPSRGQVRFRGTVKAGRRSIRACKGRRVARKAGKLTVRCRLSRAARRQLRKHALKLHLTFRISLADGATQTIKRKIGMPRLRVRGDGRRRP